MRRALGMLACALALAGCAAKPASVGSIGQTEFSAGLYCLAQYDAYQQAADRAAPEQDPGDPAQFLREQLTSAGTDEAVLVRDYVAAQTLANLERYAAVEARFAARGSALTAEQQAQAETYAAQLWEQYGGTYRANGIDRDTLTAFEVLLQKRAALPLLVYGPEGEVPVPDAELINCLQTRAVYACYAALPLYDPTDYTPANDTQAAQMLALAQAAAAAYNCAAPAEPEQQAERFRTEIRAALPGIYAVLGADAPADESLFTVGILSASVLDERFAPEAADALRALAPGRAAAVRCGDSAFLLAVKLSPAEALDSLRGQALAELKGAELEAELARDGAQLPHALNAEAMAQFPPEAIVTGE